MTTTASSTSRCSRAAVVDPSLLVFADDWGRHPSSCQHLIGHILRHRRVDWVNTIGMRPPRLDLATARRIFEKLRYWSRRPAPRDSGLVGPRVLNPRMWPWIGGSFDRRLNRHLLMRELGPLASSLATPPVAVTTIPIVANLVGALPVDRWVYYCVDDFGQWPGLDGRALQTMEMDLIDRADVLIAASEALRDRIAARGREAHLLTHGVDFDLWTGDRLDGPLPQQAAGLQPPLIIFWGLIDRRMDVAFLDRLSSDLECGTILLVGPESDPDLALRSLKRVAIRPAMPLEELPRLARHADVLIMPYADLPVTRAMQPLKLKEYLATGRPAVVRDLPSTRPWADCLDLANSPESFSAVVRKRLLQGMPPQQSSARSRIAAEGWDEKANLFEQWIFDAEPEANDTRLA